MCNEAVPALLDWSAFGPTVAEANHWAQATKKQFLIIPNNPTCPWCLWLSPWRTAAGSADRQLHPSSPQKCATRTLSGSLCADWEPFLQSVCCKMRNLDSRLCHFHHLRRFALIVAILLAKSLQIVLQQALRLLVRQNAQRVGTSFAGSAFPKQG